MKRSSAPLVMILAMFPCLNAQAGTMLQPASASTNMGNFVSFEPVRAIDQSALAATYVSGVTNFDAFVPVTGTVNGGSGNTTWFSTITTGNFDFDLGGSFNIESFALWADPQNIGQGVNAFSLLADDNALFSSPQLLGNYNAVNGIPNATNFGQIFAFTPVVATHVRMQITSNHGSALTTGMVEAAFEVVVPEPGSIGMVLGAGLGLLTLRRRVA